jgi:hypothetical protein
MIYNLYLATNMPGDEIIYLIEDEGGKKLFSLGKLINHNNSEVYYFDSLQKAQKLLVKRILGPNPIV